MYIYYFLYFSNFDLKKILTSEVSQASPSLSAQPRHAFQTIFLVEQHRWLWFLVIARQWNCAMIVCVQDPQSWVLSPNHLKFWGDQIMVSSPNHLTILGVETLMILFYLWRYKKNLGRAKSCPRKKDSRSRAHPNRGCWSSVLSSLSTISPNYTTPVSCTLFI